MSVKISELPILDSLADNDVIAGVDTSANVTSKIEMATLKNYIDTNTQYTAGTNIDITNNVVSAPNVYNKTETNNLLNVKENISNKVTTLSSSSTNTQYPSAKVVYDELNNLETDLTNDINDLNDEVDNQIQELEEELKSVSTIYNAFPTESGEGEILTLDDTAEVKFKKFDLKGNTSQTTYSGKNLFDIEGSYETGTGITYTKNSDGSYTLNGTANGNNFLRGLCYLNEQHTISYTSNVSNSNVIIRTRTGTPTAQTGIQDQLAVSSTSGSLTSSKQFDFVEISIVSGTTLNNFKIYIQLEKGSSITSFEPYVGGTASPNPDFPQPVNVVSGDNEINVVGKNLFDKDNYITDSWSSAYNGWVLNLEPGTYTLSANVKLHMIKGSEHNSSGWGNVKFGSGNANANTFTFSISENFNQYLWMSYTNSGGNEVSITKNNVSSLDVQLEKGSSASTYEPYQGNTYNIDLPVENLLQNNLTSGTLNGITYVVNDDKSVTLSGTATSITWLILNSNVPLPAGTYTMTQGYTGNDVRMYSTGLGTYTVNGIKTVTKTTSISGDVSINIPNGTVISTPITIKPMIEKGSKTNSYTPYGTTPIELCKIGNYQDYFGKSDGRNLFDKDNLTIEIGTISATGTFDYSTERLRAYYIEVDENTTYTVSTSNSDLQIVPYFYNSNKTFLSFDNGWKNFPYTFTTPSNTKYIALLFKNSNNTPSVGMIGNLQLEKGSSVSDYQPYGTGEWYYKEAIGQKILNGSESWFAEAQRYKLDNIIQGKTFSTLDENNPLAYCNGFKWGNGTSSNFVYGAFWYTANGLNLSMQKDENPNTTTLANFKTWLESNNQKVYYVLATPTITQITYQPLIDQLNAIEKAMSKDGQTNISQVNNDKPFILDVTAIKSLQNVLDRIELLES